MNNVRSAAFYGFCFGVNSLGFLNACLANNFGGAAFLGALSIFSGFACLVFVVELKKEKGNP